MKKAVRKNIRALLDDEKGRIDKQYGDISVLLVYPNSYQVGMSNLGFQTVYRLMNEIQDVRCDRGFLFPDGEVYGLESGRPMRSYDMAAFSVSYELDYPNIPKMLREGKIPLYSAERDGTMPLIIAGGAITMINPEPIADFIDLFIVGEAEDVIENIFEAYRKTRLSGRENQLKELAMLEGIYVPSFYSPIYDNNQQLTGFNANENIPFPSPIRSGSINKKPAYTAIIAANTEFSNMFLIEISRGCIRRCRFCAARKAYHPFRYLDADRVLEIALKGLEVTKRIGLVGTVISDHPHIDTICNELTKYGTKISVSSFRADSASETLIKTLALGGAQTITIAPETGAESLRNAIGKDMTDDSIFRVANMAKHHGIRSIKLYFMIGLPGERNEDIDAIADLAARTAEILPVKAAVSPFIPKPGTDFERMPMSGLSKMQNDISRLRKILGRNPHIQVLPVSIKEALLEGFYARSGREIAGFISRTQHMSKNTIEHAATRRIGDKEILPWEILSR